MTDCEKRSNQTMKTVFMGLSLRYSWLCRRRCVATNCHQPQDLLLANGYCFLTALQTLSVDDLEQLGVLRGHAQMILRALRPLPPEVFDVIPQQGTETQQGNTTQSAPPPYQPTSRARCRPFPERLTSRAWRALLLTFTVVLRTLGVALAADAVLRAGLRPSDPFPPVDAVVREDSVSRE